MTAKWARSTFFYRMITLIWIVSGIGMIMRVCQCAAGEAWSPIGLVVSESMAPTFGTGDILFLYKSVSESIEVGQVVFFNQRDGTGQTVHRVVEKHIDRQGRVRILTKGDNNNINDAVLYESIDGLLSERYVTGRVTGIVRKVASPVLWISNLMNRYPWLHPLSMYVYFNMKLCAHAP